MYILRDTASLRFSFFTLLLTSFLGSGNGQAVWCGNSGLTLCGTPNSINATASCISQICQDCYPLSDAAGARFPTVFSGGKCSLFCDPNKDGLATCIGVWAPTNTRQVGCGIRGANSGSTRYYLGTDGKTHEIFGYCVECKEGQEWDPEATDKSNSCVVSTSVMTPSTNTSRSPQPPPVGSSRPPPGQSPSRPPTPPSPPGQSENTNSTPSNASPSTSTTKSVKRSVNVTAIAIAVAVAIVAVAVIVVACICKNRPPRPPRAPYAPPVPTPVYVSQQHPPPTLYASQPASQLPQYTSSVTVPKGSVQVWSYAELHAATGGFSEQRLLGKGGFGTVYRGEMEGLPVAVKRLSAEARQGHAEFIKEVEIIGRVHHRNLVSLQGYCIEREERLLVYDFMANGSLEDWMFESKRGQLPWFEWMRILLGTAQAISYLHHGCKDKIIHRDIKPANILLDSDFEPHVADFGLVRNVLVADTHISTRVVGTFGFLAPEYVNTGHLTEKCDVYSFGVVILAVACNRRPIEIRSASTPAVALVEVVFSALEEGRLAEMVAPHFSSPEDRAEATRTISIALLCVQSPWQMRPSMDQVVQMMSSTDEISLTDVRRGASAFVPGSDMWSSGTPSVRSRGSVGSRPSNRSSTPSSGGYVSK